MSHLELERFRLSAERGFGTWRARRFATAGQALERENLGARFPSSDSYVRRPDPIAAFFSERNLAARRDLLVETATAVRSTYEIYRILELGTRESGRQSYESAIDLLARSGIVLIRAAKDQSFLCCIGSLPRWEQKVDIAVSAIARAVGISYLEKARAIEALTGTVQKTRIVLAAIIEAYLMIGQESSRARPFARAILEDLVVVSATVDLNLVGDIEEALAELS